MVLQEIVLLLMVARMSLPLLSSLRPNIAVYNSVSFNKDEMQYILNELDGKVCDDKLYYSNCCFTDLDVSIAITKLNAHKNYGSNAGLSTFNVLTLFKSASITP